MNYFRIFTTIILFSFCYSHINSQQRELFIEDYGDDNEVAIDINSDTTKLKIGIDAIGGWIKALNNVPIWFGTNNTRRMTIDEKGFIGIGTSTPQELLHISEGDIRMEAESISNNLGTGIDFYGGNPSQYLGGIAYFQTANNSKSTNIIANTGDLIFETNGIRRLQVSTDGAVRVNGFPNNQGTKNVMATADGTLTTKIEGQLIINPSDLNLNRTPPNSFYRFHKLLGKAPNGTTAQVDAFVPIDLPEGAHISRADIYYIDDSSANLRVRFRRTQNTTNTATNTTIFTSNGSPSNSTSDVKFATANTNWTIGNHDNEKSHIFIELHEERLGISSVILTYEY